MKQLCDIAIYRAHEPDDMCFVVDTWLNDWRTSKWAGVVRNCDYYTITRTLIEDLIARGAAITVAQHPKGELLGWICYEHKDGQAIVHYRYVKDPFLRKGLDEALLGKAIEGVSPGFFTFYNSDLAKDRKWTHAPEIARRKNR